MLYYISINEINRKSFELWTIWKKLHKNWSKISCDITIWKCKVRCDHLCYFRSSYRKSPVLNRTRSADIETAQKTWDTFSYAFLIHKIFFLHRTFTSDEKYENHFFENTSHILSKLWVLLLMIILSSHDCIGQNHNENWYFLLLWR